MILDTHIDDNAVAYAIRKKLKNYKPRRKFKGETLKMVKVAEDKKNAIGHFTNHDLRRTAATCLAGIGFPDETIDAVLGHKKTGVVKLIHSWFSHTDILADIWHFPPQPYQSLSGIAGPDTDVSLRLNSRDGGRLLLR